VVVDDSEALFTPCTYTLDKVQVPSGTNLATTEIVSFRGRFCEQAKQGEAITAQGKVERVTNKRSGQVHYRVIVGNGPADYVALAV
jgi:predicted nucleotidyltransferase